MMDSHDEATSSSTYQTQAPNGVSPIGGTTSATKRGDLRTIAPIRFKTNFMNTILDVMLAQGWQQVKDDEPWDFFWCEVGWVHDIPPPVQLSNNVRVCHFPTHYELTRKDLCTKNLKKYKKQLTRELGKGAADPCSFMPSTYYLPGEYHMFVEEFKRHPESAWIMKPVGRAQGKGIFLFSKLSDIVEWKKDTRFQPKKEDEQKDSYIVQLYIPNPYLIGGKKFDIRFYVLVTSFSPLQVWTYREGFARFSQAQFSMDSLSDAFVHLTNVAVQKTADK